MMKKYKVSIIGTGYVGLPLSYAIANKGFEVQGIDIDSNMHKKLFYNDKLHGLNRKQLDELVNSNFDISSDFSKISDSNVIIICVPTPLKDGIPDTSYIETACNSIYPYLKKNDLVILESTSYPGTTREIVQRILEKSNLKGSVDFKLAFSPERLMPGNKEWPITKIDKVVGGIDPESTYVASEFYKRILDSNIICVSSCECAEMVKLLENTYRYINLAFIFEFSMLCENMNLNSFEIIDAASTKPIGFSAFYPSLGIGGHCIPVDPMFLNKKAEELWHPLSSIDNAKKVLENYDNYNINKIISKMDNRKNILVIGIAYKNGIDDLRESPSLKLISNLKKLDYNVKYYDALIKKVTINEEICESVDDIFREIDQSDLIVYVNYQSEEINNYLRNAAKEIFDTQNFLKENEK